MRNVILLKYSVTSKSYFYNKHRYIAYYIYCIQISKKYLKQSILWYHGMVIRNLVSHSGAASPRARKSSPHRAAVSEMMIGTPSLQLAVRGLTDWTAASSGLAMGLSSRLGQVRMSRAACGATCGSHQWRAGPGRRNRRESGFVRQHCKNFLSYA